VAERTHFRHTRHGTWARLVIAFEIVVDSKLTRRELVDEGERLWLRHYGDSEKGRGELKGGETYSEVRGRYNSTPAVRDG
jgi:hypothetical protein